MVKMHDTLAVSSYRVFPGMLNAHQTLFSGQIFTWIDDVSSIAAQRLGCRGLATGSLDMVHLAAPVKMGDALVIRCMVSGVGHRSLEVFIQLIGEHLGTGERFQVGTAFATFVARHKEDGPLPPIEAESEFEKRLLAGYDERCADYRKINASFGEVPLD
ncbi:acyl-CoA hydrolase [Lacticaseibacillus paracasei subsp. tolerans DSM 20258]|nr:acyl-CoA hydrolase [Lacticaseibacillus paracasei subsp. tolerans DSM 20258]GEL38587.1 acyl-CoA thioesterase [Lacticaseibacillus paracasei subsp. tolerans]